MRYVGCLALLALSVGCSAPPGDTDLGSRRDPIYGGTADTQHAGAIMALIHLQGDLVGGCTGTTIAKVGSSGILLTAGHCAVEVDANDNIVMPLKPVDPSTLRVIPGPDWLDSSSSAKTYYVADVKVHPQFDGNVESPYDFAIIRFLGVSNATPVIPALSPAEDQLAVGTPFTLYGYGKTETNEENSALYKVDRVVAMLTPNQLSYDQQDGKGGCRGDSGGPAIVQTPAGERVAAVTSFGDQDCTQIGVSVRVSAVASFINSTIAEVPKSLDCAECRVVSIGPDGKCFSQRAACENSAPCNGYFQCASECTTTTCTAACAKKYAQGLQQRDALSSCECQTGCVAECANDESCGPAVCGGLSVAGAECTSCIRSSCCPEAEQCGADAACAACFHLSGTDCAANTLYQGLLSCLGRCQGNPCVVPDAAGGSQGGRAVQGDAGVPLADANPANADGGSSTVTSDVISDSTGCSLRKIAAPTSKEGKRSVLLAVIAMIGARRFRRRRPRTAPSYLTGR